MEHKANTKLPCTHCHVLPWHFLVCPGFPGIVKETEISSWCAPHAQHRERHPGTVGKARQISFWASKDLLRSQAGRNGFEITQLVCCGEGALPFRKEHFTGMRAGGPPFSGKGRMKMLIISMFPSLSSTLITISSLASAQLQKSHFKRLLCPGHS